MSWEQMFPKGLISPSVTPGIVPVGQVPFYTLNIILQWIQDRETSLLLHSQPRLSKKGHSVNAWKGQGNIVPLTSASLSSYIIVGSREWNEWVMVEVHQNILFFPREGRGKELLTSDSLYFPLSAPGICFSLPHIWYCRVTIYCSADTFTRAISALVYTPELSARTVKHAAHWARSGQLRLQWKFSWYLKRSGWFGFCTEFNLHLPVFTNSS